jgi:hypothetical protein
MATGLIAATANSILNYVIRGTAYTQPGTTWFVKMHIGDPGAAGTSNPAGNTTRVAATFGSAASGGVLSNTVAVSWTESEVTTAETYSHFSLWSAASGGTCIWTGTLSAPKAVTGDASVSFPIGDLDLTLNVAA